MVDKVAPSPAARPRGGPWHAIALGAVSVFALCVMAIPQGWWHQPSTYATYSGFDKNLIHTDPTGGGTAAGIVAVNHDSIQLMALPGSRPTVDLLASDLDFKASADLFIARNDSVLAAPLTLQIWNPREHAAYALVFGPPPDNKIHAHVTLNDGQTDLGVLGDYSTGITYHLDLSLDRSAHRLSINFRPRSPVAGNPNSIRIEVDARTAPPLFYKLPVALTMFVSSDSGNPTVALSNYQLTIPAQASPFERVMDGRATLATALLVAASSLLILWSVVRAVRFRLSRPVVSNPNGSPRLKRRPWQTDVVAFLAFGVAYLLFNGLLFGIGSHTFDMAAQRIFSYVGAYYGPADLSFLPFTVTPAQAFGGVPFADIGFPYGPVMSWFFTAIGEIYRLIAVGPDGAPAQDYRLETLLKTVNVLFTLVDGLLIYLILRKANVSDRTSRVAAALFVLNPAVWFLTSVWGETQTVTLSLVLGSVWAAQRDRATLAWILIAAVALTRPQLVVPSFLLGLLLVRWFRLRTNLRAVAWTVIVVALALSPLLFSLGPSMPASYLLSIVHSQTAGDPHAAQFNYVSYDAYNIWPLITELASGQLGKDRIYYPEGSTFVGAITYREAATASVAIAIALIAIWVVLRGRRTKSDGTFTALLASATLGLLMLDTGVSAQHFVIPLAFVILSITVIGLRYWVPLVLILSVTTLVSTYGSLGFAISAAPQLAPALDSGNNPITRFFMTAFVSDPVITLAVLGNAFVLLSVATASIVDRRATGGGAAERLAVELNQKTDVVSVS